MPHPSTLGTVVPVTFSLGGQRMDVTIPADVPLAEVLPGLLSTFGRLEAHSATQGYHVIGSDGRELALSCSLLEHDIPAGAHLTLESSDALLSARRYDDLVEAIGDTVAASRSPWTDHDRLRFSAHSSALLFLVTALLLLFHDLNPWLAAAIGGAGALLILTSAAVIARQSPLPLVAVPIALTSPLLAASATHTVLDGEWYAMPLMAAGASMMIMSFGIMVLPRPFWTVLTGPLVLGGALMTTGALVAFFEVLPERSASLMMTLLVVLSLMSPWLSLATASTSIAQTPTDDELKAHLIQGQVQRSKMLVISLKSAASAYMLVALPLVGTQAAGIILLTTSGLALLLATRSIYSRTEVYIGVITGMYLTIGAGILTVLYYPAASMYVLAGAILVAVIVLATNVVSPRTRPTLTRMADGASILALLAIPPLALNVWGVI